MIVVKILYLLSTLLIVVSAYKQTKKDVTIKLTPENFDQFVMRSKDIWFIMFSTQDCKHCKAVKGKYKLAANKMDGIVKFGEVDLSINDNGPLARRFNIEGIPHIMIAEYGLKNKRKSKMYEYTAKREWKSLVTYATNLYEQSAKNRDLVEIHELNKQSKFDRECLDEMYCVMVMLPNIQNSNAVERKVVLTTLTEIASKNKQEFQKYTWFWFQAGDQPEFMTHINPESYPVAIYSKTDKQITFMKQMYTSENFQEFLDNLFLQGKAYFEPIKYDVQFQTVDRWDGKDYWKFVKEREEKQAKRKEERDKKKEKQAIEKEERKTKLDKKIAEKKAKEEAEKEEKEKKKNEREEKRRKRKEEAEKVMAEGEQQDEQDPDAYDKIQQKAKEEKRKAKAEKRKQKAKEEDLKLADIDPETIEISKLQKRVAEIMEQTDHQMRLYQDKIPSKIRNIITKDISRLGKVIQNDPHNKIKLLKLVQKLDKDSLKIGEAIYANVDQKEIDEKEMADAEMPEDNVVIEGIKQYIDQAIVDINTYSDKIEETLTEKIKKMVDVLNKLIVETPVDKKQVEEAIKALRQYQLEIGTSIYKQVEIKEKEKKAKEAREARGEDLDAPEKLTKEEIEQVFEIDTEDIEEEEDNDDDDEEGEEEGEEEEGGEGEESEGEAEEAEEGEEGEEDAEPTQEETKEEL